MPDMPQARQFTAAQIAGMAGLSKVSVLKRLAATATGVCVVNGKSVRAWNYDAIPARLRERIIQQASTRGLSVTDYLQADACRVWQPPMPLSQVAETALERARRLQRALTPSLVRLKDGGLTCSEKEALGCQEYLREFGYSISTRYLRELIARTLRRAAGIEDFARLELFLDERPARKSDPGVSLNDECLQDLAARLKTFEGRGPGAEQIMLLWDGAFEAFEQLTSRGLSERVARTAVLNVLNMRADLLARSADALRVKFAWKYDRWVEAERQIAGLQDGRRRQKSEADKVFTKNELNWLLTYATKADNVDLGWRTFLESQHARTETKQKFAPAGAPLHTAPRWVHNRLRLSVRNLQPYVRGPRTANLRGAYLERDPDSLASGDSDQSDDKTPDFYWWEDTPDGLWIGQGQLLVWIDERSWFIYAIALITDKAYSGFSIRNSWTNKVETWGLPRERVSVERGIWQRAKVFAGKRNNQVQLEQTELGIRRLGIRLRHANYPRGKLIERLFGSLTDLFQLEPGYAGRNQPIDTFERVKEQLALCRSGKEHPSRFFLSKAQWIERLLELSNKLNTTPKHGAYHGGLTPQQAFEERFTTPLVKIPREFRHYFASNLIEDVHVGRNGVQFQFGSQRFTYKNSYELGRLKGQRVSVWFSPESPAFCSVTHPAVETPIVVEREPLVSHKATADELRRAHLANATFDAYHKEIYRSLQPMFQADFQQKMFRQFVADTSSTEFCRQVADQRTALEERQREEKKRLRRAVQASHRIGMDASPGAINREGALEARERLANLLEEDL